MTDRQVTETFIPTSEHMPGASDLAALEQRMQELAIEHERMMRECRRLRIQYETIKRKISQLTAQPHQHRDAARI